MRRTRGLVFVLVMALMCFGLVTAANAAQFSDVSADNAAYTDITKLTALEIINGYPDGTFKPDGNITRAEFAKIAVVMAGLATSADFLQNSSSQYADVAAGQWYTGWVNVASSQGYVKGYPDGTFKPNANVSAAEALTVFLRILGYDDRLAGTWPTDYLAQASKLGITDDISFTASAPATRGLIAQFGSATLEEDLVTYDNDTESFEWKKDRNDNSISLLADSFDDANIIEDAMVYQWYMANDKEDLSLDVVYEAYNEDAKEDRYYAEEIDFADDVVIAGAKNITGLEGHFVDIILNDDGDIVYVGVTEYSTMLYTDEYEVDGDDIELNDKKYDLASAVVFGNALDGAYGWINDNDFEDEAEAIEDYDEDDDVVGYPFKLTLNEDGDVAWVKYVPANIAGIIEEVDVEDYTIELRNDAYGDDEYVLDPDDNDYDEVIIQKNGEFIELEDLEVNDVLTVWPGTGNGLDYKMFAASATGEGELTRIGSDYVTIDGTRYDLAPTNIFFDEEWDELDDADREDLLGQDVSFALNNGVNKEVMLIWGEAGDSNRNEVLGIKAGVDIVRGESTVYIETFNAEGDEVVYEFEDDYIDDLSDAEEADLADILGLDDLDSEQDEEFDAAYLFSFALNSDGEIDSFKLVDAAVDDAEIYASMFTSDKYEVDSDNYVINDSVEKYDRITLDNGDVVRENDDTVIIDWFDPTDADVVSWSKVEDTDDVDATIWYDGSEMVFMAVTSEDLGDDSDDTFGLYQDYFYDGDDMYAEVFFGGELQELIYDDADDYNENDLLVFTVDGDDMESVDVVMGLADAFSEEDGDEIDIDDDDNLVTINGTTYVVADDTEIVDATDDPEVIRLKDVDNDDYILFAVRSDDEDDEDYNVLAMLVVVDEDDVLDARDDDEEAVLESITLELEPVEVGSTEADVEYTVIAEYSNGDEIDVTDEAEVDFDEVDFDVADEYTVTATYEEDGVTETDTATLEVVEDGGIVEDAIEVTSAQWIMIQGIIVGNVLDGDVESIVATDEEGSTSEVTIDDDSFEIRNALFKQGDVVTLQAFDADDNELGEAVEVTIE